MTRFFIVDVFAESAGGGNPLAVVLLDGPCSDASMQAVAAEFGFSETTFVTPRPNDHGGWPTRIFTPRAELPFAGHPTLGTAAVIRSQLAQGRARIALALEVGAVTVERDDEGIEWMTPPAPKLGDELDGAPAATALGLSSADLHPTLPVQLARIGVHMLIVPLRGLEAVRRARSTDVIPGLGSIDGVMVFAAEPVEPGNHVHARVFAPSHGIAEDPATGSANSALARYLSAHRVFGGEAIDVCVEQGHAIARPSLLRLRTGSGGEPLRVGGRVRPFASGTLDPTR